MQPDFIQRSQNNLAYNKAYDKMRMII